MPRFHHIAPEHQHVVARMQHICEHLAGERARLEAELRYVLASGGRAQAELVSFLQRAYGVDAQRPGVIIDADKGVITEPTPEPTPQADPEPEPETATQPTTTETD